MKISAIIFMCLLFIGCDDFMGHNELARIAFCSGYRSAIVAYRNEIITDDMNEDLINALVITKFNELMKKGD